MELLKLLLVVKSIAALGFQRERSEVTRFLDSFFFFVKLEVINLIPYVDANLMKCIIILYPRYTINSR